MEPGTRWVRAKLTGMLMQSFRERYAKSGQKDHITQDELLDLMGQVDPGYFGIYDRSTVSKWETGKVLPTRERLEVFGNALNLAPADVEGMLLLAGLEQKGRSPAENGVGVAKGEASGSTAYPGPNNVAAPGLAVPSFAGELTRFVLTRFLLPGAAIAGCGYLLASIGWSADWMFSAYIVVVICAMLSHYFLRLRPSGGLRNFLFVSVFVLLSTPILQAPLMRMDHFGFYAIESLGGTPIPYVLALLVNLLLAFIAGMIYDFLSRWQTSHGETNPYRRAAWVSFPPLAFVYICMLFISGAGVWLYLLEALPILGGVIMAILVQMVLRDENVEITLWTKRFMLQTTVAITILLTIMSLAGMVVIYWDPSLQMAPDHTLVRSWEIDFNDLGYSGEEFADRSRISTVWSSLAAIIYMVVIVGGSLVVTILKKDPSDSAETAPSPTALPSSTASRKRRSKRSGLDAQYRPAWLGGHRIPHPPTAARVSA